MSKPKGPTKPPGPDEKVIPFPTGDGMTLDQRLAEIHAVREAASAELMLRIKYSQLKSCLDTVDQYDPVPDDWRARLLARDD